ncbi:MAG TPA: hypothetical protein VHE10_00640 [Candidatus Paceibacterota bacterium]|nr:hypothetical protein [Candidatus Paceibacterota bacterium]
MSPFISFVVTARNDDYGGNWTNRINAFIKVLIYQTNRTKLWCELVFVEYNPPAHKKHIYEELVIEDNRYLAVRFVTVPASFHKTLPDNEKVTVCEFIGKNIGMRRSKGEWIVATNPDVLYSDKLFDFFAAKELDANSFYRINRKDMAMNWIDPRLSAAEVLARAEKDAIKIMYNDRTVYLSFKEWLSALIHGRTRKILLQCPFLNPFRDKESDESIMHTNAAGDFLMMHRGAVEKVRGYDQMTVGSGTLDGYILYVLYCFGLKQKILPHSVYHIYHHHKGVRYLASFTKFQEDTKKMLETKIPYKTNPEDWGFPRENFAEVVL